MCETFLRTMNMSIKKKHLDLADWLLDTPEPLSMKQCFIIPFRSRRCKPTAAMADRNVNSLLDFSNSI